MSARWARARKIATAGFVVVAALGWPARTGTSDAAEPGRQPASTARGASAVVEELHATLQDVMRRAKELGYAGRHARLAPVIAEVFDLPLMARKATGRHWKTLSEADRERMIETFSRLAVANYAGRFDGYSGERFETLSEEPAAHDTVLVGTKLVKADGDSVRLDYRLRASASGWRIFDVFLDGTVSEMALRRAEYSSVIRREGFEALLSALEAKIAAEEKAGSS